MAHVYPDINCTGLCSLAQNALPKGFWEAEDQNNDGVVSWAEFTGPKGEDPDKPKLKHEDWDTFTGHATRSPCDCTFRCSQLSAEYPSLMRM